MTRGMKIGGLGVPTRERTRMPAHVSRVYHRRRRIEERASPLQLDAVYSFHRVDRVTDVSQSSKTLRNRLSVRLLVRGTTTITDRLDAHESRARDELGIRLTSCAS